MWAALGQGIGAATEASAACLSPDSRPPVAPLLLLLLHIHARAPAAVYG